MLKCFYHFQPAVAFAGEHCHPSFYSTGHGAYLTGRSAAQFFLNASKNREEDEEEVYNLSAASVADLSTWLEEVALGQKNIEDFKKDYKHKSSDSSDRARASSKPRRDDGSLATPR